MSPEINERPLISVYEGACPRGHFIRTTHDNPKGNGVVGEWIRCSTCGRIGHAERADTARKDMVRGRTRGESDGE